MYKHLRISFYKLEMENNNNNSCKINNLMLIKIQPDIQ